MYYTVALGTVDLLILVSVFSILAVVCKHSEAGAMRAVIKALEGQGPQ
jgi:hypothetical protein